MKIKFYGAAGCVTGSCHILKVKGKTILLDCGMYQGKDQNESENREFNFDPKKVDYVILSHAHVDHSGRIPLLYKKGFKGEVICTEGTKDLCSVMLPDSGHIHEMEVEWKNRKRIRKGMEKIDPLYTAKIAEVSMYLFKGCPYEKMINLFEGFKVRFKDAGHLLGSSIVEMFIKEDDKEEVKLVYTGDLGNLNIPIIKDPTKLYYADYIIMETTYGNRIHERIEDEMGKLADIIKETFKRGGNVIIPSFAVGRTQEVIYQLKENLLKNNLQNINVYVDSPLASESTRIFKKYNGYYDEDSKAMLKNGENPLEFKGLKFTKTPQESMNINKIPGGAVIISSSGMCEAGRIRHHLKHNLWREECSIVFVGYQAEGTLGRKIVNGARKIKLFGDEIAVKAHIYNLQGLSGHADQNGLINWLNNFSIKPKKIMLVHGDGEAQNAFKNLAVSNGFDAEMMKPNDIIGINEIVDIIKEKSPIRDNIIKLLDNINNIENMDKEELVEKIKNVIYSN